MPIFNFYAFVIKPKEGTLDMYGSPVLAGGDEGERAPRYATPEECFGSFYVTNHSLDLNVMKCKGKGTERTVSWEKYRCDVLRHEGGVILLTIENNRVKHTTVDKKDRENEHHPYCHVVVDNRPGHGVLGIERNAAFDGKPDKVAAILSEGMGYHLHPYNLRLELTLLQKKSTEFWQVIDQLRTGYGDVVKQVRLDFDGSEQGGRGDSLMALMSSLAKRAGSEGVFILNAQDDGEVKLQEVHDDLTHIADFCLRQSSYALSVKFRNFGIYRYGAELLAQFGADEELLSGFELGERVLDFEGESDGNRYELVSWLDRLAAILQGYEQQLIQQGRKRRRRR